MTEEFPQRKKLPHEVPSWVPLHSRYFLTINAKQRKKNTLCIETVAEYLLNNMHVYEEQQKWFLHVAIIMPDHLHFIVSFSPECGIQQPVKAWKAFQKKSLGVSWQSGFFEHRLRNEQEFEAKAQYIRENPVRKGLVKEWSEWPYFWSRYLDQ